MASCERNSNAYQLAVIAGLFTVVASAVGGLTNGWSSAYFGAKYGQTPTTPSRTELSFVNTSLPEMKALETEFLRAQNALHTASNQLVDAQVHLSRSISQEADLVELMATKKAKQQSLHTQIVGADSELPVQESRVERERRKSDELAKELQSELLRATERGRKVRQDFSTKTKQFQERKKVFKSIGRKRWQNVETGVTFTTDADPNSFTNVDPRGYPMGTRVTDSQRLAQLAAEEEDAYRAEMEPLERIEKSVRRQSVVADAAGDALIRLTADRKRWTTNLREIETEISRHEDELIAARTRRSAAEVNVDAAKTRLEPLQTEANRLEQDYQRSSGRDRLSNRSSGSTGV